jgi:hypothetical protein
MPMFMLMRADGRRRRYLRETRSWPPVGDRIPCRRGWTDLAGKASLYSRLELMERGMLPDEVTYDGSIIDPEGPVELVRHVRVVAVPALIR